MANHGIRMFLHLELDVWLDLPHVEKSGAPLNGQLSIFGTSIVNSPYDVVGTLRNVDLIIGELLSSRKFVVLRKVAGEDSIVINIK